MVLSSRRLGKVLLWPLLLAFLLIVQANRCPTEDALKTIVRPFVDAVLDETINRGRTWRLHWMPVSSGTTISSLNVGASSDPQSYTCRGRCVLFFLDLDHWAHYAHSTRILVLDSKPSDRRSPVKVFAPTQWWPTIQEPSMPGPMSVFDTVSKTVDPTTVLHLGGYDDEMDTPWSFPHETTAVDHVNSRWSLKRVSTGVAGATPAPTQTPVPGGGKTDSCDSSSIPVWAILVGGAYDPADTFDEDVSGMYAVLRGFGVPDDRIRVLSPIDLPGVRSRAIPTEQAIADAFGAVKTSMESCVGKIGGQSPHFLLFWASHGTVNKLLCNLDVYNQTEVCGCSLRKHLESLEGVWSKAGAGSSELLVSVVIEACQSGTVGTTLWANGAGKRWILTSATQDNKSYRDIDQPLEQVENGITTLIADPNPADAGSETIWGYVEAYGSWASHSSALGFLTFQDALEYVKANDVTFLANNPNYPRDIGILVPPNLSPTPVHGAWNATTRSSSTVTLSAPAATGAPSATGGASAFNAPKGQATRIKVDVENPGSTQEVGALALRLFRNNEASPDDWTPVYYEKDGIVRTTVMVPGLAAGGGYSGEFDINVPKNATVGESIRLVATLDSGQPWPTDAQNLAVMKDPADEITLLVTEGEKKGLCSWLKRLFARIFGS
ncbi:MAG TPA: hypothetical protein VLB51_00780 [Methylomirabilota bacterium]|nr:hypothetical protein [Methylomirabilota bacterium]